MRKRIYKGKIEILRKVPGMIKLCEIARQKFSKEGFETPIRERVRKFLKITHLTSSLP